MDNMRKNKYMLLFVISKLNSGSRSLICKIVGKDCWRKMSLVDYGSSDSDDEHEQEEKEQDQNHQASIEVDEHNPLPPSTSSTTPHNLHRLQQQQSSSSSLQAQSRRSSEDGPSQHVSTMLLPPFQKLPDAALLLSSPILSQPIGTDHSARVAAAVAENASRKREANGSGSSFIREKIPRSNLPHSKNIPETSSGLLTPPQLQGRSNVVTEDINKLFVQRKAKEKS
ncbi:uncharacterized protein LOC141639763 [Silene latifolia]|uniref:uncharacterized protein LOC141639763 n=1 Tax=Silene latifolia TaxID=37657 RepID=UPI003D780345